MLTTARVATVGRKLTRRGYALPGSAGGWGKGLDWLTAHARHLMLMIAIGLAAAGCAGAPPAREAGPPRADAPDLVAVHNPDSPAFRGTCLGCHVDLMTRATLKVGIKNAHAAMVPMMPDYDAKTGVTNDNCRTCHAKVDVIQHSGMQIRKNTDPTSCAACHGKSGAASKKFYAE